MGSEMCIRDSPFSDRAEEPPPLGRSFTDQLVLEKATVSWGDGEGQQGSFDQVLATSYDLREEIDGEPGEMTLTFALRRSVRSRVLWDERPGGLLLDNGFVKVRRLTDTSWRIVSSKAIRFSDRTPALNDRFDAGQLINYLAPAALAWWSETEIYKLETSTFPTGGHQT